MSEPQFSEAEQAYLEAETGVSQDHTPGPDIDPGMGTPEGDSGESVAESIHHSARERYSAENLTPTGEVDHGLMEMYDASNAPEDSQPETRSRHIRSTNQEQAVDAPMAEREQNLYDYASRLEAERESLREDFGPLPNDPEPVPEYDHTYASEEETHFYQQAVVARADLSYAQNELEHPEYRAMADFSIRTGYANLLAEGWEEDAATAEIYRTVEAVLSQPDAPQRVMEYARQNGYQANHGGGDMAAISGGQRAAVNPKGGTSRGSLTLEDVVASNDMETLGDMKALKELFRGR